MRSISASLSAGITGATITEAGTPAEATRCDSTAANAPPDKTTPRCVSRFASLALALGLADVVTAEAAGTPMEALFIDEGFGTLDEETLDEVMNVLDGLRAGGRIVGIVSHVTELRQRVPAQVHVRKSRSGSRVEITAG